MTMHQFPYLCIPDESIKVYSTESQAKLVIYIMLSSIIKVNPSYFGSEAMKAIAESEKELLEGLKSLDESVSIDDLVVSIFSKERLH